MKIAILSIFPEMFEGFLNTSIIGRARAQELLDVSVTDIRPYSERKHKNTDDYPFGGGAGMVMLAQPIVDAVRDLRARGCAGPCVYMSPRGKPLTQETVRRLAGEPGMILLCGHYEGVDQRAIDLVVDEEISLGDFVLTGGELPAMALTDAVARYIPGVLGSGESTDEESFSDGLLEYPQYTRPRVFEGVEAPEVLLSGDHARIRKWRREQSLAVTLRMRPDLFEKAELTPKERDTAAKALERMLSEEAERKARNSADGAEAEAEAFGTEMASTETPQAGDATGGGSPNASKGADAIAQAHGATNAGSPSAIKGTDATQADRATGAGSHDASENEKAPQLCGATNAGSPNASENETALQACGASDTQSSSATGAGSPNVIKGADAAQSSSATGAGSPNAIKNASAPQADSAASTPQASPAPTSSAPNIPTKEEDTPTCC